MSLLLANAAPGQGRDVGGLAIVLLALVGFYLVCAAVDYLHKRRERHDQPRGDQASLPKEPSGDALTGGLSEEVLVVIAAAAAAAIDQPHRIVGVRRAAENAVWSLEGRRSLFASRQLKR